MNAVQYDVKNARTSAVILLERTPPPGATSHLCISRSSKDGSNEPGPAWVRTLDRGGRPPAQGAQSERHARLPASSRGAVAHHSLGVRSRPEKLPDITRASPAPT